MRVGIPQQQRELTAAFEHGLVTKFGPVRGPLYAEVARYKLGSFLEKDDLRKDLDMEAVPVLDAILTGKVNGATLRGIRSLMIGAGVMDNREAVVRWATMGLDRTRQLGGEWAGTEPQWEAVLQNPEQFVLYARQIKYFLMQI